MAEIIEVLEGKGVLWHGRKKVKAGDPIPADLSDKAYKALKAKGRIKEVVAGESGTSTTLTAAKSAEAKAKALDEAENAAKSAEAKAKDLDIGKLVKAVQTAKGARTKAVKAAEADKNSAELATKVTEAETAVTDAEAELADANVLAETAVRLRLDADVLANG